MSESRSNIFISWSKDQAAAIAPVLKQLLDDVLGKATIFLSQDIDSGRRWSKEIAEALQTCNAGVLIVTEENKLAPWLQFEAGAISKDIDEANVIPLLWNIPVGDIRETPLAQFQSKSFTKDGVLFVCKTLGSLQGVPMDAIERRFQTNWPQFEKSLSDIGQVQNKAPKAPTIADAISLIMRLSSQVDDMERTLRRTHPVRPLGGLLGGVTGIGATLADLAAATPQGGSLKLDGTQTESILRLLRGVPDASDKETPGSTDR